MSEPLQDYSEGRLENLERRVDSDERRGGTISVLVAGFAAMALIVSVVGVGLGLRAIDESNGTGSAAGGSETIDVELGDLWVKPSSIEVPAGTEVMVNVTNSGAMPHDLVLAGGVGTAMLEPGERETVSLGVVEADTEAWCTVPGHRDAGMTMDIVVTGGSGVDASAGEANSADAASIDFSATTPVEFTPYDPNLAPAPGGTEHTITMRATETVMEVAPGVTQELWTFDDQVPGPMLRGKVGDLFTVTLVNDGEIGHSIDFHSSKVAWNDEMRTIAPGESLVYQYRAEYAGIFMYHCGTAPALHHIGNGMFGAIVIDPPNLPAVDHELVMVQSEFYLGPDGEPGSLAKMQDDAWDAVVFNGYVNQYLDHPIAVEADQRIRVWVLDAGPSENSSFHVVGLIFDTVFKEGAYLLQPGNPTQGGSQALDLQPAQGGFVEFTLAEDGLYPFVTHKFSNVGKGAIGLFNAGGVEVAGGGH
ncbi:multicopper oxidase domain-containing protein [Rhabdothermincola salaria]|uniref:multicopper oxidase domain-containing protein n=1 Tax=Rhabdothermincola salaria TaxID=2903142 RepID=UPI001E2F5BF0|nr:multicopper oxidase domain-containing protein [Rhabdothermincola salaria]MCD9625568.1 multicopper oxidase domain-containing protein [Rhabdothermincola salaria]